MRVNGRTTHVRSLTFSHGEIDADIALIEKQIPNVPNVLSSKCFDSFSWFKVFTLITPITLLTLSKYQIITQVYLKSSYKQMRDDRTDGQTDRATDGRTDTSKKDGCVRLFVRACVCACMCERDMICVGYFPRFTRGSDSGTRGDGYS